MITLDYRPKDPSKPVMPGMTLTIPHIWAQFAAHEVTVEQVWPDRTGQLRYWASGKLASNGETVLVIVAGRYPQA